MSDVFIGVVSEIRLIETCLCQKLNSSCLSVSACHSISVCYKKNINDYGPNWSVEVSVPMLEFQEYDAVTQGKMRS